MTDIRFGYCLPIFANPSAGLFRTPNVEAVDGPETIRLGVHAESIGYDSLWVADHLMLGRDEAILEGWTTLSMLAGATHVGAARDHPPVALFPVARDHGEDDGNARSPDRGPVHPLLRLRAATPGEPGLSPAVPGRGRPAGHGNGRRGTADPRPVGGGVADHHRAWPIRGDRCQRDAAASATTASADLVRRDAPGLLAACAELGPGVEHHAVQPGGIPPTGGTGAGCLRRDRARSGRNRAEPRDPGADRAGGRGALDAGTPARHGAGPGGGRSGGEGVRQR